MSRGPGEGEPCRQPLSRKIKVRVADMPRHYEALRYAADAFGDDFPQEAYEAAARSTDPAQLTQVYAVEHGFELLVNSISQLVRETLEQHGLREPDDSQNAPADLRAFCEAGAITKAQRDRMISLCRLRNELQHEYPDVRASSIHEGVKVLLAEIGPFMQSYSAWLKRETV
jgi:uncharacterized protein YutE (UPF0331/DUF86 family)